MNKYMIVYHDGAGSLDTYIFETGNLDTFVNDIIMNNKYHQFLFDLFEDYLNITIYENDDDYEDEVNAALEEAGENLQLLEEYIKQPLEDIVETINERCDEREDPYYSILQFDETDQQFHII